MDAHLPKGSNRSAHTAASLPSGAGESTTSRSAKPLQQIQNNCQSGCNNNNEQEDYGCESAEQYDRVSSHSLLSKSASSQSFVMGDEKMDCELD